MREKLQTVFQEALRLLYNVSPRFPWEDRILTFQSLSKNYTYLAILRRKGTILYGSHSSMGGNGQ